MKTHSKIQSVRGRALANKCNLIVQAIAVASTLFATTAHAGNGARQPEVPLPLCENLQASEGERVLFHAYALGVQVYTWNGSVWVFEGPEAGLYADRGYHGQMGIHYQGPTWEANDGSAVRGALAARCSPSAAIPWLRLTATPLDFRGLFAHVTSIQRVNTVGGIPDYNGTTVGEEARIPYTAEYYFYTTYGN